MQAKIRDGRLDAIKWIAMITMVIDHIRFIYNDITWFYAIGRISFPFFCLAITINVYRNVHSQQVYLLYGKYILWMMTFSLISEIPYRLYFYQSNSLSIMPTLTLGLLIAITMQHYKDNTCRIILVLSLGVSLIFKNSLMYGVFGVLLPTAFLLALIKPMFLWPLPMIVGILSNYSVERIFSQISDVEREFNFE
ncbi:TraX family protein, partial [Aeromonas caviae]|uniref:TraX family protein n=1 Tax=Aeromonas caviae TaxID=648 RepID=UPI0009BB8F73